jgi:hypothetical protein
MSGSIHLQPIISSRFLPPEKMEIKLTDTENQVCTLLDECTRQMKEDKGLETSCRIAGGWVRDKVNSPHSGHIQYHLVYDCSLLPSYWAPKAMISTLL